MPGLRLSQVSTTRVLRLDLSTTGYLPDRGLETPTPPTLKKCLRQLA